MTGPAALWDAATAHAIGADWLHAQLAPAGDFGRKAQQHEPLLRRGDEVRARDALVRVADVARAVDGGRLAALRAALAAAARSICRYRSRRRGRDARRRRFLRTVALSRWRRRDREVGRRLKHSLTFAPPCRDTGLQAELALGRTPERSFFLADAYAPELAHARAQRNAAQAQFDEHRSRLAAHVAEFAGLEHLRDGEFMLMRDRTAGALPPQIRVLREAPTYLLCELLLDDVTLKAQSLRDAAATHVADEEEVVRGRLSRRVASSAAALERACTALGALDLLVARAMFAQQHACAVPQLVEGPQIAVVGARYLPLATLLAERGRPYVPLDFELSGVAVITGPNMGGKTAALRTLGFLIACVAYGVPVPAQAASVPLVDAVTWLGITAAADEPRAAGPGLLSAFASEIVAVQSHLQSAAGLCAVLIDEFAGTTSPGEGRALLVALLATLQERGALALASTHFDRVAGAAGVAHYATGTLCQFTENAAPVALDTALERIAHAMDYRIRRVETDAPADTGALALAAALGLDSALLARARSVLNENIT